MKHLTFLKLTALLVTITLSAATSAQTQIGTDIDGEAAGDNSGWHVSMPDANTVAIGAILNDGNGTNAGNVRIYSWNGSAWMQKGTGIDGEAANDDSGWHVSMPDANTVAIGAGQNDGNGANSGHVRIYTWNGSAWLQKGTDIDGEATGDKSGFTISMPDASTVAIGTPFNAGNGTDAGHVRIYSWNGSAWLQKGSDIDGEAARDKSGFSVSMPDANTVAIGAIVNDGNGTDAGHARIYSWNGSTWLQKGADIDGEAADDNSGRSVSMPDANTVAIGAAANAGNGTDAGHVRIYSWNGSAWLQKGTDIDGEAAGDYSGWQVSMPDANTVAIGAIGNGLGVGHVRIYAWNGSAWVQQGNDIDGEAANDNSGWAISMPDVNTVGIGAPYNDGNGTDAGHVRVYKSTIICNPTSSSASVTACDSHTWLQNGQTYTVSGAYTDTVTNVDGCDSIITLHLTINHSTDLSTSITACDSYTWLPNGQNYTISGAYTDTVTNAAGCDSIITLHLTINYSTESSTSVTSCDNHLWQGNTYTISGAYKDTVPDAAGCDSIITLNLTINSADTSVTANGPTLIANATDASYQWINCNSSNTPIAGETNQLFTAKGNGSYAVVVTQSGCADTSACYMVTIIGILENNLARPVVHPNPTNGRLTADLGQAFTDVTVSVKNLWGQEVYIEKINATDRLEIVLDEPAGVYFVMISSQGNPLTQMKVLKQ